MNQIGHKRIGIESTCEIPKDFHPYRMINIQLLTVKAKVEDTPRRNVTVTCSALSFCLTCSCFLRFLRRWNRFSTLDIRKCIIIHSIINYSLKVQQVGFLRGAVFVCSPSSWLCVALPSVWLSPPHSDPPLHLMHPEQTHTETHRVAHDTLYLHPYSPNNVLSVWPHLFTCDKVASSLGSGVAAPQSICSSCCWTGGPVGEYTWLHSLHFLHVSGNRSIHL